MLEKLKALNVDKLLDMDECVAMYAFATQMDLSYTEDLGLDRPEWLGKVIDVIKAEIDRRLRADRLRELKEVEGELESLKTQGERKADAQRRLAKLQGLLGVGSPVKAGK